MTFDDVARIAAGLPDVTEAESGRSWSVSGKAIAWERPFSKADIKRFGDETPPDGPSLPFVSWTSARRPRWLRIPPRSSRSLISTDTPPS
jgi:hypothetical protein